MEELFAFGAFGAALAIFNVVSNLMGVKEARELAKKSKTEILQIEDLAELDQLGADAKSARSSFGGLSLVAAVVFAISLTYVLRILQDTSPSNGFDPVRALTLLVSAGWLYMTWRHCLWTRDAAMVAKTARNRVDQRQSG